MNWKTVRSSTCQNEKVKPIKLETMLLDNAHVSKTDQKGVKQVICNDWYRRTEILDPDVNLFCWKRSLNEGITTYLNKLKIEMLPGIGHAIDQKKINQQLTAIRGAWEKETILENDPFWTDVEAISYDFLQFSKDGTGVLHLRMVDHNACAKFHTDGYYLRLFTTYLGPGTEWLPEEAVDREALGTDNEQIVLDRSRIQQMKPGEVGILKGDLFKNIGANGIVHRSPEVASTRKQRIILRVDIPH